MEEKYTPLQAFVGYNKDANMLRINASGGICAYLSKRMIEKGGFVFGVSYSPDFKSAEYIVVSDTKNIYRLNSSKYIETNKFRIINGRREYIYDELIRKLKEGALVLFIGLGCDLAAVKTVCKQQNCDLNNLFLLELLCHGCTFKKVHRDFVENIERKYDSKVKEFNVRFKKKGWTPPYLRVVFENNEVFEKPFYSTDYGIAFENYARQSCYNCKFKNHSHQGDLVVGDAWGIKKGMNGWNKYGVSSILVQNNNGYKLLELLDQGFYLEEYSAKSLLKNNLPYYYSRKKKSDYDSFILNLQNKGLHYAIQNMDINILTKIKYKLRRLL